MSDADQRDGPTMGSPQPAERRRWERPQMTSVPIHEVESLLAENYKAQATAWAAAAKRARGEIVADGGQGTDL